MIGRPRAKKLPGTFELSTPADIQILDEFLVRAPGLRRESRLRLGSEIAARVAAEIGAETPAEPEAFLHRVSVLNQLETARRGM